MACRKRSNWTRHALVIVAVAIAATATTAVPAAAEDKQREWTIETKCATLGAVAVSVSGDRVAYADYLPDEGAPEGRIWICDLRTGAQREVATVDSGDAVISMLMFSPDDRYLAAAVASNGSFFFDEEKPTVWVLKATSGDLVATLDMVDNEWAQAVSFSGDSQWLVGGTGCGAAYLWDIRQILAGNLRPHRVVGVHAADASLDAAAISHDGQSIVLAGELFSKTKNGYTPSTIQVWDAASGSLNRFIASQRGRRPAQQFVGGLICSPTSNEFAISYSFSHGLDGKTVIYDRFTLTTIVDEAPGEYPAYSLDGLWMATEREKSRRTGRPGTVLVKGPGNTTTSREIPFDGERVFSKQFIRSGELIILDGPKAGVIRVRKIDNLQS